MPRLRLRTVLACLAVFCATPALARVEVHSLQHKSMGRVLTVRVSEEIAPGDYETLLKGLRNNPGTYSRKLLLLNSIGGSVPEAIRMGRLLRESGFDALVPSSSVCQGTCVYLLAAGKRKTVRGRRPAPSLLRPRRLAALALGQRHALRLRRLLPRNGYPQHLGTGHAKHRSQTDARAFGEGTGAVPAELNRRLRGTSEGARWRWR